MAKLGTPENPEIIEPGHRPAPDRPPAGFHRARAALRLIRMLAFVLAPALGLDTLAWWLVREGWWPVALLLAPGLVVTSLLALIGTPFVLLALVLLALGRPISIQTFGRGAKVRIIR